MNLHTFSALAEPNRLHIVELLQKGPRSVNEISHRLNLNQPQTSKHLRVLADAGLVMVRPVAQQRFYQLRSESLKELDKWLDKYRSMWEEKFSRLDVVLNAEKMKLKGDEKK